jgi:hypothetical protein
MMYICPLKTVSEVPEVPEGWIWISIGVPFSPPYSSVLGIPVGNKRGNAVRGLIETPWRRFLLEGDLHVAQAKASWAGGATLTLFF